MKRVFITIKKINIPYKRSNVDEVQFGFQGISACFPPESNNAASILINLDRLLLHLDNMLNFSNLDIVYVKQCDGFPN